ncbi:MAG TPA: hypothetical protein VMZ91_15160 [Candidatus Paceibacterota bacterium]|nr:hypothetical protein [Candidatus Paceibacterota bacterium]
MIEKNQSTYQHKGNFYPEYFFTVKWNDREKEVEIFEVGGKTYFTCKSGESVYFKRLEPDYEWVKGWMGFVGFAVFGLIWIGSGLAALLKNL